MWSIYILELETLFPDVFFVLVHINLHASHAHKCLIHLQMQVPNAPSWLCQLVQKMLVSVHRALTLIYISSLSAAVKCDPFLFGISWSIRELWISLLLWEFPFDSGLMVWDCCCCNTNWEISWVDVVNTKLRRSGVQQRPRAVPVIPFLRVCFRSSSQDGSIKNGFRSQVGFIPCPVNEHPIPEPKTQTITTNRKLLVLFAQLDISRSQLPLELNFMRYLLTSCGTSLWEILLR